MLYTVLHFLPYLLSFSTFFLSFILYCLFLFFVSTSGVCSREAASVEVAYDHVICIFQEEHSSVRNLVALVGYYQQSRNIDLHTTIHIRASRYCVTTTVD